MTPLLWMALGAVAAWGSSFALLGVVVVASWAHGALERRRQKRMAGWERIPH